MINDGATEIAALPLHGHSDQAVVEDVRKSDLKISSPSIEADSGGDLPRHADPELSVLVQAKPSALCASSRRLPARRSLVFLA